MPPDGSFGGGPSTPSAGWSLGAPPQASSSSLQPTAPPQATGGLTPRDASSSRSIPIGTSAKRQRGHRIHGEDAPASSPFYAQAGMMQRRAARHAYDDDEEEDEEEDAVSHFPREALSSPKSIQQNRDLPPPRKRPHYDFGHEVGRFASLSIHQGHSSKRSALSALKNHTNAPQKTSHGYGYTVQPPPPSPTNASCVNGEGVTLSPNQLNGDATAAAGLPPAVPPSSPEKFGPSPLHLGLPALGIAGGGRRRSSSNSNSASNSSGSSSGRYTLSSAGRNPSIASMSTTHSSLPEEGLLQPSLIEEPEDKQRCVDVEEVEMRERRGPSQWEYEKDKIWVQSLDSSSNSDGEGGNEADSEDDEREVAPNELADARPAHIHASSTFGTGDMEGTSFLLNTELMTKLEEEAKKRMLDSQTIQQEQRRARSLFRKPKILRMLSTSRSSSAATSNSSTASTNTPNNEESSRRDPSRGQNALVLWRSAEEVLQSRKQQPTSQQQPHVQYTNFLDFEATKQAILLQEKKAAAVGLDAETKEDGLKTETMDVSDYCPSASLTPSNGAATPASAETMELD